MTRFLYDQFAKDYLEELLQPLGKIIQVKQYQQRFGKSTFTLHRHLNPPQMQ
ncbi:hypothetical protein [Calothrix sp. CCY 0018]|uniref:hypothetical protein n=1 Tax=Calothrix sp. CCY 0018 TaxID=3103864 RepID=UPI0039C71862